MLCTPVSMFCTPVSTPVSPSRASAMYRTSPVIDPAHPGSFC